jgi:ribonuclease BN (tRNA processing enzyme)
MRLTVVGCAGSFPQRDSPASCYLVEAEGFRVVIDLGNGALGALQRYAAIDDIDAVLISHLHGDHCIDLGAYGVARHFGPDGPQPPIPVYAPAAAPERLAPVFGLVADELAERFTFRPLEPGSIRLGPLAITADHMNHPVETFGFRLEHDGAVFAYSADTGETPALVRLAAGAGVLLCEATGASPDVHLSARQAAEHAARAGAGELVLTHLSAWRGNENELAEAAAAFAGPVSLATPGLAFGDA